MRIRLVGRQGLVRIAILCGRVLALLLACSAFPVLAQVWADDPGVFVKTGNLNTARSGHTAILLRNGKVLVAGGATGNGDYLGTAELYDPGNGTWTPTGSMLNVRDIEIATLLPNGNVLVVGGFATIGEPSNAEIYNPENGTWSPTGLHPGVQRYYFRGTLLPNGKVLTAGGVDPATGDSASAELYDPESGTWTPTGSMVHEHGLHTVTLLPNGKVLVVAGFGSDGVSLQSAELYDPESGMWALTGSPVGDYFDHRATLLPSGKVLVTGCLACSQPNAELYDPLSGIWGSTPNLITQRIYHTTTLLEDGEVLAVAGMNDYFGNVYFDSGELYDPESETWMAVQDTIPFARVGHTATLLPNGQVLLAGGIERNGSELASAQLYISASSRPSKMLNLSTRVDVLDGNKIAIGGFIVTGTDPKTVLIRGLGPSLSGIFGGGTLMNPKLELYHDSTLMTSNDDWKIRPNGSSQQAEIKATTIPPTNDLESAILRTLAPGAYTVTLSGTSGGTGVGLVEIYDVAQSVGSKLANLSTRGYVDTGDKVMIGGFIVGGGNNGGARVIVRALGPSVPVAGALADPTLELRDGSGTLVDSNDNWKLRPNGSSQQAEIEATGLAPTNDLESALVQTLPAGNYTAIVQGTHNSPGLGLMEIYRLQ